MKPLLILAIALIGTVAVVMAQPPGDRFGGQGGPGGERRRGRFDPAAFLERFDRNQNGRLDPEEVDGRSRAFLQRFAPGVDVSRPVPLEVLKQRMQVANGESMRSASSPGAAANGDDVEPLVPGFGEDETVDAPVPGFGSLAEFFNVKVVESDLAETREAFRRYDRDGNGLLDAREMRRGRWFDDPTAYDQNRDGKLSERELAIRYARRRISEAKNPQASQTDDRSDDARQQVDERKNNDGPTSYRFKTAHERLPEGLPAWFREQDADQDGQISMFEFVSSRQPEAASEFAQFDRNGDGLIVADELLEKAPATPAKSEGGAGEESPPQATDEMFDRYLRYASSIVKKYDRDGDNKLSREEMASMRRRPEGADKNGDGKVSPEEFARHLMKG